MSRRRYISTEISFDTKVNRLALEHSDFAVLFYTWMIPHVRGDGSISNDPERLLWTVVPGRRDKGVEDIKQAVAAIISCGLGRIEEGAIVLDLERWDDHRVPSMRHRKWRFRVLARDGHHCRSCGSPDHLHAHHRCTWASYPEQRYDVSNGVTLCAPCHRAVHSGRLVLS